MDADWGSSSDEETVAEREKRDEEKRKETMALLAAFEATRGGARARATRKLSSMRAAAGRLPPTNQSDPRMRAQRRNQRAMGQWMRGPSFAKIARHRQGVPYGRSGRRKSA